MSRNDNKYTYYLDEAASVEPAQFTVLVDAAASSGKRTAKIPSGDAVVGESLAGVLLDAGVTGTDTVAVQRTGRCFVKVSAAFAKVGMVGMVSGTNGRVRPATDSESAGSWRIGYNLETAAADGDIIEFQLAPAPIGY